MDTQKWMRQPIVQLPVSVLEFNHDINFVWVLDKIRRPAENYSKSDFPLVVLYEGTYWVEDGHHRVAAAILQGQTDISVRLLIKGE